MGFGKDGDFIQNQSPEFDEESLGFMLDESAAESVEKLKDFATKARALKAQAKQASRKDSKLRVVCDSDSSKKLLTDNIENLTKLVGASEISVVESFDGPAQITELGTVYIDVSGADASPEDIKRLEKELEKLTGVEKATVAALGERGVCFKGAAEGHRGRKKNSWKTAARKSLKFQSF